MDIDEPITSLPGIGLFYQRKLKKLKIETIEDLLYHIPRNYLDYSLISKIGTLQEGETVTIKGEVTSITNNYVKGRRLTIQKAVIADETGSINLTWFNQSYLIKKLKGKLVNVAGKVGRFGRKLTIESPEYEISKESETVHTGRLVPVYPETQGISSKWLRAKIAYVLSKFGRMEDPLPPTILKNSGLMDLHLALLTIHQPENKHQAALARRRLAFDELFYLQLTSLIRRNEWNREKVAKKIYIKEYLPKIQEFVKNLPFLLTNAQKKVAKEILYDLSKTTPMNRLLQGDVGSGKTVVAAIAIFATFLNGYNSLFMAPTEILAYQHFQTLSKLLLPFGVKIALRTASIKQKDEGCNLIIGTHALFHHKKPFKNVALVIIDEQHRFGVEQRARLKEKGLHPHLLTMTATPIPRTIALTLYGELDMSIIDEMPKGRKIVKTYIVPKEKYAAAFNWIRNKIKKSKEEKNLEQAYIIYPLIEESEILTEVKAAKKEYEYLKNKIFPDLKVGLLHGKMIAAEKNKIVEKLRRGDLDVLVATSVVEVGMDIPNATIIAIEGADRFGLAQLHQLRGRVGRNERESYCLLFAEKQTSRLSAMEKYFSGIRLAEIDLKIRGPGEIYGVKQHGREELKIASLSDIDLIEEARKNAQLLLEENPTLSKYPPLLKRIECYLSKQVEPD